LGSGFTAPDVLPLLYHNVALLMQRWRPQFEIFDSWRK